MLRTANESTQWREPGFSLDGATSYVFKKGLLRANTSFEQPYFEEPTFKPTIFREYVATDKIPESPPEDFVELTTEQIVEQFSVTAEELSAHYTYMDGVQSFKILQSESFPYLYEIHCCRMRPVASAAGNSFNAVTDRTKINLLASSIPFSFGSGEYRGKFFRTTESRELSMGGHDNVLLQQVAFIFDPETGFFTLYAPDVSDHTPNPISVLTPPSISCYLYRGNFGRFGWSVYKDSIVLDETRFLVGTMEPSDMSLVMDVRGSAYIDDLLVNSVSTKSDIRLKDNIRLAPLNMNLLNLAPRYYNYKTHPGEKEYGLIAQEVEEICPEVVKTNHDGYKSVQYDRIGVGLLQIVKNQEERVLKLEKENVELREMVLSLIKKLSES